MRGFSSIAPVLFAVGCAHLPGSATELLLDSGPLHVLALVDGQGLTGVDLAIGRSDKALSGQAFHQAVALRCGQGAVDGTVGKAVVKLEVKREQGTLVASGVFAGDLTHLRAGADGIDGTIGGCSYSLAAGASGYEGVRSCKGQMHSATLKVPAQMTQWSDSERVAALGLLLAAPREPALSLPLGKRVAR